MQTLHGHSGLQLKIVKALKNVSSDPELLTRLQDAEAIEHLVPLLDKERRLDVRREVCISYLFHVMGKSNPFVGGMTWNIVGLF